MTGSRPNNNNCSVLLSLLRSREKTRNQEQSRTRRVMLNWVTLANESISQSVSVADQWSHPGNIWFSPTKWSIPIGMFPHWMADSGKPLLLLWLAGWLAHSEWSRAHRTRWCVNNKSHSQSFDWEWNSSARSIQSSLGWRQIYLFQGTRIITNITIIKGNYTTID